MLKPVTYILLISILLVFSLTGCLSSIREKHVVETTTIAEHYPGYIANVTKIELFDGSSGEAVQIIEQQEVNSIIDDMAYEALSLDKNQEPRTGYVHRFKLYEEDQLTMDFIPSNLSGSYYVPSEALDKKIKELFILKFEKQF